METKTLKFRVEVEVDIYDDCVSTQEEITRTVHNELCDYVYDGMVMAGIDEPGVHIVNTKVFLEE